MGDAELDRKNMPEEKYASPMPGCGPMQMVGPKITLCIYVYVRVYVSVRRCAATRRCTVAINILLIFVNELFS